jgi:hypothetical protein
LGQEPAALTDEQITSDETGATHNELDFEAAAVNWGRTCEAALSRVCSFHVALGLQLPADLRCDTRASPRPAPRSAGATP